MIKNLIRIILLMLLLKALPTIAKPNWPNIDSLLSTNKFQWHNSQTMVNNGVPMNIAMFSSELEPVAAAALMTANGKLFQRVLSQPKQIVLSGVHNGWHWLANVSANNTGSTGYVSALQTVVNTSTPDSNVIALSAPTFSLPPQAVKVFDQHFNADDSSIHQRVFKYKSLASNSYEKISSQLISKGWVSSTVSNSDLGYQSWQRGQEQLILIVAGSNENTHLFVQHVNKHAWRIKG